MRRLLLEFWAMFVLAAVVGFLGPFDTYEPTGLAGRILDWSILLLGAYLVVRPAIFLLGKLAAATGMRRGPLVFWGVWFCSAPLVAIWLLIGKEQLRMLEGLSVLLPSSLLCALAVLGVVRWASGADLRLAGVSTDMQDKPLQDGTKESAEKDANRTATEGTASGLFEPPLANRLSPRFAGPILALQGEDHYVRVHGASDSELLLMRLRDAIAEMEGVPGEQVHRSWWVARIGIDRAVSAGRSWVIHLTSGQMAPVARESVTRLKHAGFLP
ncbi:LytTR family DNA-binding domain-containing protein [Novosphingobium album (ex Hu et al. 2023)]|uniref:LytTR family transcriptional regulator DNA-binding domain-containing protein n=1 Tax=Novosphingobium album (ex Hu et al. 2023) TaxID=2930093 RepID=A0ABT0B7E8_9SPHN|nr:LytTR family DNA-binding domain-containing protein [Novosphingobium album (ex Hu et al. 2023)]MCJ2180834.1 LytTR family transcriptional regulator DNA-binding domain-containing protein [Novosphingobium album (ex Hu et al. 2023)]